MEILYRYKTENLIFPLCLLYFVRQDKIDYNDIITYSLVRYAERLLKEDKTDRDGGILEEAIEEGYLNKELIEQENSSYKPQIKLHQYIAISSKIIGVSNISFAGHVKKYNQIENMIYEFESRNGKDATVKINKGLLFEVRDKKFDERLFHIYAGIKAVVCTKDIKRITVERIKYAMHGFKSKKVCGAEGVCYNKLNNGKEVLMQLNSGGFNMTVCELLTDRQIKTSIDKLRKLKFIEYYTYKRRVTYFTTNPAYRGDDFVKLVVEFLKKRRATKNLLI